MSLDMNLARPLSPKPMPAMPLSPQTLPTLTHLDRLEAESIHILREVAAEFRNPVMLYSIGKDSSVLLHLLLKAFAPAKPPIPLLHVDTTWKFGEMIAFRDRRAAETGVDLRVHINPDGLRAGHRPGQPRRQRAHRRDEDPGAEAGAGPVRLRRRDRRRAPRRGEVAREGAHLLVSAASSHRWDPKNQRPELWSLYNTRIHAGRIGARVPDLELDRARRVAVHLPRKDSGAVAVLRRAAAGGRARRRR